MRKGTTLAAVVVLAFAGAASATVAVSAATTPKTTATCTSSPAITPGATSDSFRVTCSVPKQPTATVTVTQTVTATASPTSTPTVTSTPTLPPTSTVTATPTTSVPTTTATTTSSPTTPAAGFPTANTTGPRVATSPGSGNVCGTVSGRLITGDLVLGCDSTVTDSRIMGRVVSNGYRLTGSYLEIGGSTCPSGPGDYQLVAGPVTLDHSHIHHNGEDLVRIAGWKTTITESLIDDTCYFPGAHLDAVQFYDPGAVGTIVLDHNSIDVRPVNSADKGNSAIFLADNPGRGTTITATNNLLAGGQYAVAAYDAYAGSGVRYDIRDNTFVRGSWQLGPCTTNSGAWDGTSGLRFTGNRYDDGFALSSC